MATTIFPTKGNLIATKKSLILAKLGYDLLDRKRNILIREMMLLVDKAKMLRGEIENTYKRAYAGLQRANITLGVCEEVGKATSIENGISIKYRSVMGVDIPEVSLSSTTNSTQYGFFESNSQFDIAYLNFNKAKDLTIILAEVENSVYRLADAIKKTQRRANALKNINIPRFETTAKFITDALEEKEREEFTRLKVIRYTKVKNEE
ncbi:MAG: V-type ATP synthase subunit D [Oscillospiraceae bacterium]